MPRVFPKYGSRVVRCFTAPFAHREYHRKKLGELWIFSNLASMSHSNVSPSA